MLNGEVCPSLLPLSATSPLTLPKASTAQGWGNLYLALIAAMPGHPLPARG